MANQRALHPLLGGTTVAAMCPWSQCGGAGVPWWRQTQTSAWTTCLLTSRHVNLLDYYRALVSVGRQLAGSSMNRMWRSSFQTTICHTAMTTVGSWIVFQQIIVASPIGR